MRAIPAFDINMRMDLRQIRYFVAVAEHENFHRAAEAVHVAQSALSRHIRILSDRLGGPLFERTPNGVKRTLLGQVFYTEAKALLDRADGVLDRTRKALTGEIGRLVVGVNEMGARNPKVTRCITACRRRFPEMDLVFERMYSAEQVDALRAGKLDAGILIERPEDVPEFQHLKIDSDPFVIGMPENHPLASKDLLDPSDLASEPFVGVRASIFGPAQVKVFSACRQIGFTPKIIQESVSEHMQLSLIRDGLGVGFVNKSIEHFCSQGLALRPVHGLSVGFEIDLVWMQSNRLTSLDHFLDVFRTELEPATNSLGDVEDHIG